jgi:hypothetical protein
MDDEEKKAPQNIPTPSFPNFYTIPTTSGIEVTVEAGKDNHFDIKLKGSAK